MASFSSSLSYFILALVNFMNDLAGKKILFICPRFFGYEREIERELINLGACVDFYDERPFKSSVEKILNRLNLKFSINNKINNYYSDVLQRTVEIDYDYLFVIAPETMTPGFLKELKLKNKKIKTILYLWDSIKNKKNVSNIIEHFDKVFTFDRSDLAVNEKIAFLPLFYIAAYSNKGNACNNNRYNLAFIGTAHSGRFNIVNAISKTVSIENTRDFLFFFSPSKLVFFLKKLLTNELNGLSIKNISFKPMTPSDVYSVLANSNIVIDIEHPGQNGLTMRTIEMLGMQKKLITTNKNVVDYDFYNPSNILVIDRSYPHIPADFLESSYQPVDETIRHKYCISAWLTYIFSCP